MPELPSGDHIAVDPAPLEKLIFESDASSATQLFDAIEHIDDLFGWLELVRLVPEDAATPEQRAGAKEVFGAPAHLVAVPTGVRLSDWPAFAAMRGWAEADYAVMATFINERLRPWLAEEFEFFRRTRASCRPA